MNYKTFLLMNDREVSSKIVTTGVRCVLYLVKNQPSYFQGFVGQKSH